MDCPLAKRRCINTAENGVSHYKHDDKTAVALQTINSVYSAVKSATKMYTFKCEDRINVNWSFVIGIRIPGFLFKIDYTPTHVFKGIVVLQKIR